MHNTGKIIGELHALLIEYEKCLPKKAATPQVMHPTKDDACHHCKEVGNYKRNYLAYLAELIKKKKQVGTASSSENCHYAPTITRGVVSVSCLVDNGFIQCFTDYGILVSKNYVLSFNSILSDGIYGIDMLNLVLNVNSIYNDSYFITFMDDYSRYGYVYLLKHKHEVFETFKVFRNEVEDQLGKTIMALRSDREGEYISQELKDYLKSCGIFQQFTPPYAPQHNGVSERRNQTATCILNMVPSKKLDKTPYELWYGKVANLSYLKETVGYYFYFPPENRVVVAWYAGFLEKNLLSQEVSGRAEELEEIQDKNTSPSKNTKKLEVEVFEPPQEEVVLIHSLSAFYDYEIWQMDVKTAFLNGYLNEDIYMVQPEGFVDPNYPRKVCKLQRSIYGLKQASRSWNKRFDKEIKMFGFAQNLDEPYLGEAAFILGIKIYQDRSKRLIGLSQSAYIDKILKRFRMDNSKRGYIPIQERLDLNKTQGASTPEKAKRYVSVLNEGAVDWKSSKQSTTAMSATKAEYIAASEAAMEAVWIRKFILGLGIVPTINKPIKMFCDNSATLLIANKPGVQRAPNTTIEDIIISTSVLNWAKLIFLKFTQMTI
ncbi:retrotransposon protein, putative, ty1-copia subclass [Tanacetum coccineum]